MTVLSCPAGAAGGCPNGLLPPTTLGARGGTAGFAGTGRGTGGLAGGVADI